MQKRETTNHHAAAADELLASVVSEKLDIALIPANVASVLYQKTEGQVSVIDINTLGVLSMISGDSSIASWSDLAGKRLSDGKGNDSRLCASVPVKGACFPGRLLPGGCHPGI